MNDPERYQRVRDIFHRACALEPTERARFLDEACDQDESLRTQLDSLLAPDTAEATEALRAPIVAAADAGYALTAAPEGIPERIGAYRISRLLGQGGMGAVYEAEQDRPHRRVALKLLLAGLTSQRALRRFEHEAEMLGRLQHPGIAQIYEASLHEGRPYFAMELVDGPTLTDYAADNGLDTRDRLRLFVRVCSAVHHAHTKGVVHRDLKPGNILVTEIGDPPEPQPKVLDFGIARVTDSDIAATTRRTDVGEIIGTLPYMSPEQVAGDAGDIDTRSDVYALGVVLYELLAGRLPYDLGRRVLPGAARIIQEVEPTPLSSIDSRFRGDIETIVGKALEKERDHRYPSALDLASDLSRYLADEPITARPPSTWYQLEKFARRNRGLVCGVTVAFTVLVLGLIGTASGLAQARGETARAEEALRAARWQSYVANIRAAQLNVASGNAADAQRRLAACPEEFRHFEWRHLSLASDLSLLTLDAHEGSVHSAAFSPDGSLLASGSADGTVRVWDAATGKALATLEGHAGEVFSVAFSPDGRRLASGSADRTLCIWDVTTGNALATLEGHAGEVFSVAFSPDGGRLASGSQDRTVRLWDAAKGEALAPLEGHGSSVQAVAFSPDGRLLGACSWGKTMLWDAETREVDATLEGHAGWVYSLAFSPDGERLASGSEDRTVRLWDVATRTLFATLKGHGGVVYSVAFSPDGKRLASGSRDNLVRIWDARTGEALAALLGHTDPVRCLAFSADSRRLASGSVDGTVRLWDAATSDPCTTLEGPSVGDVPSCIAFTPDGVRAASGSYYDKMVHLWDAATGDALVPLRGHEDVVGSVVFSPDGARLASISRDQTVRLWNVATGHALVTLVHEDGILRVAFSPDGAHLATVSEDGTIRIWDVATGAELVALQAHGSGAVAFSPDSRRLASASERSTVVLDASTGEVLETLDGHEDGVCSVAFSPDGGRLASGSNDRTVRLWDTATGNELATLEGHNESVVCVAFSPDGERLASGSDDGTVRLWDATRGDALTTFAEPGDRVWSVAFSRDGAHLAAIYRDGSNGNAVRVWTSERELATQFWHAADSHGRLNRLLDALFEEFILPDRVVAHLEQNDELEPELRASAIARALARKPAPVYLNNRAWLVVDPNGAGRGDAAAALEFAHAAVELDDSKADYSDTLAWALYANGRYDKALLESERALERAAPDKQETFRGYLEDLRKRIEDARGAQGDRTD